MLIPAGELKKKIDNIDLILIDSRSFKDYLEGHIPGAVNFDFFNYHWSDTSKEGIISFERQTRNLLSTIGVTEDKTIVFYDDVSGMSAARGVWTLMYFSHPNTFMLDGGIKKWQSLGFPLEKTTNGFKPSNFTGKINSQLLADYEFVKENIGKTLILDTRTRGEFNGTIIRTARSGHIPSAVNIDWMLNINEDGTMKSDQELAKLYPFSKDDEIITYCQGSYRAANSFVALNKLGFKKVRVYLGSWGEWGNKIDLPVDT